MMFSDISRPVITIVEHVIVLEIGERVVLENDSLSVIKIIVIPGIRTDSCLALPLLVPAANMKQAPVAWGR